MGKEGRRGGGAQPPRGALDGRTGPREPNGPGGGVAAAAWSCGPPAASPPSPFPRCFPNLQVPAPPRGGHLQIRGSNDGRGGGGRGGAAPPWGPRAPNGP